MKILEKYAHENNIDIFLSFYIHFLKEGGGGQNLVKENVIFLFLFLTVLKKTNICT